jgi:hypothetical protein
MNARILLVIIFIFYFAFPTVAQGNLQIFPKRIVFDGIQTRSATVNLNNVGKDTATYTLSYNEIRMGEDGSFNLIEVPETNQHFASPYLRYFPRTITLAPNAYQTVKIQLIRTNDLKQGEYRSHLYFRAVKKTSLLKTEDTDTIHDKTEGLNVDLRPVFGLSIANIINIGDDTTTVQLTNLALDKSQDATITLSLDINRQGNRSAYGNVEVNHISIEGITHKVATVQGFAIYSPGTLLKTKIKLDNSGNIDYSRGELQVIFTSIDQSTLYTKATLNLNQASSHGY